MICYDIVISINLAITNLMELYFGTVIMSMHCAVFFVHALYSVELFVCFITIFKVTFKKIYNSDNKKKTCSHFPTENFSSFFQTQRPPPPPPPPGYS